MESPIPSMSQSDWDSVLQLVAMPPGVADEPSGKPPGMSFNGVGHTLPKTAPLSTPQIPTPPASHSGSHTPPDYFKDAKSDLVSISTTFYPGAHHNGNSENQTDLVILSSDNVWFYVNTHQLLKYSSNGFDGLLPCKPHDVSGDFGSMVAVSETSVVINVVLHTLYDLSCAQYTPDFDTLSQAIASMHKYGVGLRDRIAPSTPLFALLMSHAPVVPLPLYTVAAKYNLYDLAAFTSSYLHSITLSNLTDEMASEMGPVYLKRLFFLHYGRSDALKRILAAAPHPHAPTRECDFTEQKKLSRAWALASAYLAWDARPDLPNSAIESALSPLGDHVSCDLCRESLRLRIKTLESQWADIKRTI